MRSLASLCCLFSASIGIAQPKISFQQQPGKILIRIADKPFATYSYQDEKISRPYFAHLKAPNGAQVTRNHPPQSGDFADHATYHPGLFLAFGDISGHDYWRLKAKVVLDRFTHKPWSRENRGGFTVRHRYLKAGTDQALCIETFQCQIVALDQGHLLMWDSTFEPVGKSVVFGDQEEMGLGVRVATSIAVKKQLGGRMLDSQGRRNEKQIWGRQAKWCDYSGKVKDQNVGVTLMPHPKNFRPSWFHARDYGVLVANPFGRNAFTRKEKSKLEVTKKDPLHLRFGVLIHDRSPMTARELNLAWQQYLDLSR